MDPIKYAKRFGSPVEDAEVLAYLSNIDELEKFEFICSVIDQKWLRGLSLTKRAQLSPTHLEAILEMGFVRGRPDKMGYWYRATVEGLGVNRVIEMVRAHLLEGPSIVLKMLNTLSHEPYGAEIEIQKLRAEFEERYPPIFAQRAVVEPRNIHWVHGVPASEDLCAHGGIVVKVDDLVLIDEAGESWNLSAGALHLLRTLEREHTVMNPVADHLIPCCGHSMCGSDSENVYIGECPYGTDFRVYHQESSVLLELDDERRVVVPYDEWRKAVLGFADEIQSFYDNSDAKEPKESDSKGYASFRREWERRVNAGRGGKNDPNRGNSI